MVASPSPNTPIRRERRSSLHPLRQVYEQHTKNRIREEWTHEGGGLTVVITSAAIRKVVELSIFLNSDISHLGAPHKGWPWNTPKITVLHVEELLGGARIGIEDSV